jgi:erythromycin esterase
MKITIITFLLLLYVVTPCSSQIDTNYSKLDILPFKINSNSISEVFDSIVSGKRVILLGEQIHTCEETNHIKSEFIKYLHTKHGFKVVLWESNIGALFVGNKLLNHIDSDSILRSTLYNFWRVKSNYDLFEYIKLNNLEIGGFDIQGKSTVFAEWMYMQLLSFDGELAAKFIHLDNLLLKANYNYSMSVLKRVIREKYVLKNRDLYISTYTQIKELVTTDKLKIELKDKEELLQCLNTRIHLVDYLSIIPYNNAYQYREHVMFENLLYYIKTRYPNEKIIVWAANKHVEKTSSSIFGYKPSMTNYLINYLKPDEYLSIGINSSLYKEKYMMIDCYDYNTFINYISKNDFSAVLIKSKNQSNNISLDSKNFTLKFDFLILLNRTNQSKFD